MGGIAAIVMAAQVVWVCFGVVQAGVLHVSVAFLLPADGLSCVCMSLDDSMIFPLSMNTCLKWSSVDAVQCGLAAFLSAAAHSGTGL